MSNLTRKKVIKYIKPKCKDGKEYWHFSGDMGDFEGLVSVFFKGNIYLAFFKAQKYMLDHFKCDIMTEIDFPEYTYKGKNFVEDVMTADFDSKAEAIENFIENPIYNEELQLQLTKKPEII